MKVFLVYILCYVKYTQTQYPPINKKPSKSPCDGSEKSALVEHFFNMIFTEFQNSPPICVCVQMCIGQSTYCYPNGCLKRGAKRETEQPVSMIENAQSSIFLVDQKNDVTRDLFTMSYDNASGTKSEVTPAKETNMRPDPFKDKYKSLFKYKKMPKVELRYNLREQVKNTRTDVLRSSADVSHTRWPQTKHSRLNGYAMLPDIREVRPVSVTPKKFFKSSLPDNDVVIYPLRYFKRDLSNVGENKLNVSANLSKDSSNYTFSLETLIDSLIENNFLTNNTIKRTIIDEPDKTISNETSTEYLNETNILLINATDVNLDKSKYTEAINYTNVFNELIAKLSKKIESRNNTSMEIMKQLTNNIVNGDDLSNEIDEKVTNRVETTIIEPITETTIADVTITPTLTNSSSMNTTESVLTDSTSNDHNGVKTIKSRQRYARKLGSRRSN